MTTFTPALKKNINVRSLTMRVRIFQPLCYGIRRCAAHGLRRSRFHSTRRKVRHHVTWCLAKTSYPTSRWDVMAVSNHCSRTALPIKPPETQNLAAWEPAVHWTKHFVHRIARIWTLPSGGALQQTVYHHQSFSSVDKMKRAIVKSMAETTAWRSHCQYITFITFLFTVNVIRQMAPIFSKVDSNKLWLDV